MFFFFLLILYRQMKSLLSQKIKSRQRLINILPLEISTKLFELIIIIIYILGNIPMDLNEELEVIVLQILQTLQEKDMTNIEIEETMEKTNEALQGYASRQKSIQLNQAIFSKIFKEFKVNQQAINTQTKSKIFQIKGVTDGLTVTQSHTKEQLKELYELTQVQEKKLSGLKDLENLIAEVTFLKNKFEKSQKEIYQRFSTLLSQQDRIKQRLGIEEEEATTLRNEHRDLMQNLGIQVHFTLHSSKLIAQEFESIIKYKIPQIQDMKNEEYVKIVNKFNQLKEKITNINKKYQTKIHQLQNRFEQFKEQILQTLK